MTGGFGSRAEKCFLESKTEEMSEILGRLSLTSKNNPTHRNWIK
jgi:hypothetical protein